MFKSGNLVRQFFVYLENAGNWSPGVTLEFTVGVNAKGIAGNDPRLVGERGAES